MNARPATDDRIMRIAEVVRRTSLARATLYRMMAAGTFPSARRLGGRSVGWLASEIDQWLATREQAVQP